MLNFPLWSLERPFYFGELSGKKMIAKILTPTRVTPRMDNEEFFGELSYYN